MEEQKFPSRSDRHKKKKTPSFINHSDLEEIGSDAVEDTSIKEKEALSTTEDDYHSNEQDMQMHATVQELLAELESRNPKQKKQMSRNHCRNHQYLLRQCIRKEKNGAILIRLPDFYYCFSC